MTMETKFTPGPWAVRIEFGTYCIRPADYRAKGYGMGYAPIAKVTGDKRIGQQEENARLIAAAPELLAALDRLLKADCPGKLDDPMTFTRKNAEYNMASSEARAAIAKATGA